MNIKTTHITVDVTIPVSVSVDWIMDHDDDGCASPSVTGNSMTGRRGYPYYALDGYDLTPAFERMLGTLSFSDAESVRDQVTRAVADLEPPECNSPS